MEWSFNKKLFFQRVEQEFKNYEVILMLKQRLKHCPLELTVTIFVLASSCELQNWRFDSSSQAAFIHWDKMSHVNKHTDKRGSTSLCGQEKMATNSHNERSVHHSATQIHLALLI